MDESFKLQITMSPKPLYTRVHIKKPTKLALRKNIRRSSCYDKPPAAVAPVNKKDKLKLELSSDSEFDIVASNIDDRSPMFADLSIIPKDNTMKAMNSTFVEGRHTLFHELFQGSSLKNKKANSNLAQVLNEHVIDNIPRESKTSNPTSEDIIRKIIPENHTSSQNCVGILTTHKENRLPQTSKHCEESFHIISDSSLEKSIVESSISPEKEKDIFYSKREDIQKVLNQPSLIWTERVNEVLRTEPKKKISEKINQVHKAVCQTEVKKLNSQKSCNGRKLYFDESESDSEDEQKNYRRIVNVKAPNFRKNKEISEEIKIVTGDIKKAENSNCPKRTLINKRVEMKKKLNYEPRRLSDLDNDLGTKKIYTRIVTTAANEPKLTKAKVLKDENNIDKDKKLETSRGVSPKQLNACNADLIYTIDSEIINIANSDDEELNSKKTIIKKSKNSKPLIERSDNILKKSHLSNSGKVKESTNVQNGIENDNFDDARKVLDEVYGSSWREKEHEILRTEPRKMVSIKPDDVLKPVNHTDIKKIESNRENVNQNLKLHLFNGGKNNNVYTESPLSNIPSTLKKLGRRKLFCSVESEDDEFESGLPPVLNPKSSTSKSQTITRKNREVSRAKPNNIKKPDVKSTAKNRGVEYLSDSDSESVESFGPSDSDCESGQGDYFPKYIKNSQPMGSTQKKQKSFLESLSKNVPIFEAHPAARIFRNDFKKHRDELTARLFKLFNEDVFDTAIPINTSIEWNSRLRGTAGYCRNKSITHRDKKVTRIVSISLSNKVLDSPDRLRDTLIHEMCHAVNWMVDGQRGHGPSWKIWTEKARNTFPELPPMSTCHNYSIITKYTYRCKDCGYSFGRHSKSLSVEAKCCGYCKGRLELLVNKVSKSGLTNSAPVGATPTRNPTPFALFVKDNYKKCKTPDLKHGDVMRMLSKQFSSLKIEKKIINVE